MRPGWFAALACGLVCGCQDDGAADRMEAIEASVCACEDAACAAEFAPQIRDIRGLDSEDYINLPQSVQDRHQAAWDRAEACLAAFIPPEN